MADAGSIWVRLGLQDQQYNRGLDMAQRRTQTFGSAVSKIGGLVATAFSVYAIISFAKAIYNLNAEFAFTMSRVKALTGATDAQEESLTRLARQMGSETQYTAQQAGDAMTYLAMAGLDVDEIMKALPGTLELAAAGNLKLAEAADIATNVMSAYNLTAEDLGHVNDVIANTATTANTDVHEFAEAFKMVGPIAKSAGLEIEGVATEIGILANSGIKGTLAGTSLRAIIAKLINPSKDAAEALARLNITTTDGEGNMLSLSNIMQQLHDSGANTADMFEIFDNRAAAAAAVLASNAPSYEAAERLIRRDGTAAEIASVQMDNLKGDTLKLKSAWQDLLLTIGDSMEGGLRETVEAITDIIHGISYGIESIGVALDGPPWTWLKQANVFSAFGDLSDDINSVLASLGIIKEEAEPVKDAFDFKYNEMSVGDLMTALSDVKGNLHALGTEYVKVSAEGGPVDELSSKIAKQRKVLQELEDHLEVRKTLSAGNVNIEGGDVSGGSSLPILDNLTKRGRAGLDDFGTMVDQVAGKVYDIDEILNREPPEPPDFTAPYKEVNEVLDDSITKISAFRTAHEEGLMASEALAQEWAEGIVQATVMSGAGIQEYVSELRNMVRASIAVYAAEAAAAAVTGAIKDTALEPWGWLLIPAVAAGAAALVNTAFEKLIPSFGEGIDYVPYDMVAKIHKGEKITPASENTGTGGQLIKVVIADVRFPMRDFVIKFRQEEDKLGRV